MDPVIKNRIARIDRRIEHIEAQTFAGLATLKTREDRVDFLKRLKKRLASADVDLSPAEYKTIVRKLVNNQFRKARALRYS